jgi:polysaccharide export outer membrane protein
MLRPLLASIFLFATLHSARTYAAQAPAPTAAPADLTGHLEAKPIHLEVKPGHLEAEQAHLDTKPAAESYQLGPEDILAIRVQDMEEIGSTAFTINLRGDLILPRVGRIHAAGLTLEELESAISDRYRDYLQTPIVTVSLLEFHSQPVSILGAVANPGIHQVRGSRTLFELISEAGGLRPDAGSNIIVTRRVENGPLPLKSSALDPSGGFYTAQVDIHAVMDAHSPEDNIAIKPNDVISVPKAEMIYVLGSVKKPGGYVLSEKPNFTVMEILSMAEGLDHDAGGKRAKILRPNPATHTRTEIPIDVAQLMKGKGSDIPLYANDILFVPVSGAKVASNRAVEALITVGSAMAIYSHPF